MRETIELVFLVALAAEAVAVMSGYLQMFPFYGANIVAIGPAS